MKKFLPIAFMIFCICCNRQKQYEFNTQTLNLKGNIKHITERTGESSWDLEFVDNQLSSVDGCLFHYEGKKLKQITEGGQEIDPEIINVNFQLRLPLYGFQDADSLVRNNWGDVVQVFSHSEPREHVIQYTYDSLQNWTIREVFIAHTDSPIERTDRTILYFHEVSDQEIASWNSRLDSIYVVAKERNQLVATIDNTIEGDYPKLKKINRLLTEKYEDVKSTESYMRILINTFDTKYGQHNLSADLHVLREKLNLLQGISQRESYLWREASEYVPKLISGKKSVKDLQEPFTDRYILTYSLELISDIRDLERKYEGIPVKP